MLFTSRKSYYDVSCPDDLAAEVQDYVDAVEQRLSTLEETLRCDPAERPALAHPLRASFELSDGAMSPRRSGSRLRLDPEQMRGFLRDPANRYNGLFHATAEAILDKFGKSQGNHIPESMVAICQTEALRRLSDDPLAREAAERLDGTGGPPGRDPCRDELWSLYREHGFRPFEKVLSTLRGHRAVLRNASFRRDWNAIVAKLDLPCAID